MGVFHVSVRIRALDRTAAIDVDMIVDTGATRTLLPGKLVDELRLQPDQRRPFRLANGEPVDRDMGWVWLECHGRSTYTLAILGEQADAPLLGAITLEELGFEVDPVHRALRLAPEYMMAATEGGAGTPEEG